MLLALNVSLFDPDLCFTLTPFSLEKLTKPTTAIPPIFHAANRGTLVRVVPSLILDSSLVLVFSRSLILTSIPSHMTLRLGRFPILPRP